MSTPQHDPERQQVQPYAPGHGYPYPQQSQPPQQPLQPYGPTYGYPPAPAQHQQVQPYQGGPGYYPPPTAPPKSPGVATILSLIICGMGHLYTGNPLWAVFWFFAAIVSGLLISLGVGLILLPLVWIGAGTHAYVSANDYNRRHHAVR